MAENLEDDKDAFGFTSVEVETVARAIDSAAELGMLSSGATVSPASVLAGLAAVVSVYFNHASFGGNRRTKLMNPDIGRTVEKSCRVQLSDWLRRHPNETGIILQHVIR